MGSLSDASDNFCYVRGKEVVATEEPTGRYLTADEIKSGKYAGRMHVRVASACQQRDRHGKPYLEVEYQSTLDQSPWRLTARYFNVRQADGLMSAVNVDRLEPSNLQTDLVGQKLDVELGTRHSKGEEYPTVTGHYQRVVGVTSVLN